MNKITFSVVVLFSSASLFGQIGALYSPPWMASTEGSYYSYYVGRYTNSISQLCDGELRGSSRNLTEIAMRQDYRSHSTGTGMGRTWTNLTIHMCESSVSSFGSSIAANRRTPQTQVFSAQVKWPTLSGYPIFKPDLWGGLYGSYRFPFTTKWIYSGIQDLLSEWTFRGGRLANNVTWTGSSARNYYLDSYGNPLSPTGSASGSQKYIPASRLNNSGARTTCNDSAITYSTGAYTRGYAYTYGQYYNNRGWASMLRLYSQSYYTGYDMPTIHAYAIGNYPTGINAFNTGCNMLHLKGPIVLMDTLKTSPKSIHTNGYSGYREMFFPWSSNMAGFAVTVQAVWTDSRLNKLLLSQAAEITFPSPQLRAAKRYGGHSYSATATTLNYRSPSYTYNPGLRYLYQ